MTDAWKKIYHSATSSTTILKITLEPNTDHHGKKQETDHQTMAQRMVLQTDKSLSNGEKTLAT